MQLASIQSLKSIAKNDSVASSQSLDDQLFSKTENNKCIN
jgi:hypothetical protein